MQAMRHATHQKHGGNNNNNQQNHPGGSGVQNNQNGILLGNGQLNGAILPTMQMGFDFGPELAGFCSPGKLNYFLLLFIQFFINFFYYFQINYHTECPNMVQVVIQHQFNHHLQIHHLICSFINT